MYSFPTNSISTVLENLIGLHVINCAHIFPCVLSHYIPPFTVFHLAQTLSTTYPLLHKNRRNGISKSDWILRQKFFIQGGVDRTTLFSFASFFKWQQRNLGMTTSLDSFTLSDPVDRKPPICSLENEIVHKKVPIMIVICSTFCFFSRLHSIHSTIKAIFVPARGTNLNK